MEETIFETPWIKVKRTPRGFDYLERKGKDSVAIALCRTNQHGETEVLVRYQPLCVHNAALDEQQRLYPCLVTGGLEEGENAYDCAIREIKEETGYEVTEDNLGYLTTYIAGTQTNESVYLYFADVNGLEPTEATQDGSYFESISHNEWKPLGDLKYYQYVACKLAYFLIRNL